MNIQSNTVVGVWFPGVVEIWARQTRDPLTRRRVVLLAGTAHYMGGRLAADEFVANRVRSGRKQP